MLGQTWKLFNMYTHNGVIKEYLNNMAGYSKGELVYSMSQRAGKAEQRQTSKIRQGRQSGEAENLYTYIHSGGFILCTRTAAL